MKFTEEAIEEATRSYVDGGMWKEIYENAPEGAKKRLRVAFWASRHLDEGRTSTPTGSADKKCGPRTGHIELSARQAEGLRTRRRGLREAHFSREEEDRLALRRVSRGLNFIFASFSLSSWTLPPLAAMYARTAFSLESLRLNE